MLNDNSKDIFVLTKPTNLNWSFIYQNYPRSHRKI